MSFMSNAALLTHLYLIDTVIQNVSRLCLYKMEGNRITPSKWLILRLSQWLSWMLNPCIFALMKMLSTDIWVWCAQEKSDNLLKIPSLLNGTGMWFLLCRSVQWFHILKFISSPILKASSHLFYLLQYMRVE